MRFAPAFGIVVIQSLSAHAAHADAPRPEALIATARNLARAGQCDAVAQIALRVYASAAALYDRDVVTDPTLVGGAGAFAVGTLGEIATAPNAVDEERARHGIDVTMAPIATSRGATAPGLALVGRF